MPIAHVKNIFVPFFPSEEESHSAAISYAITLAAKTRAHVTVRALAVRPDAPYSPFPGVVGSLVESARELDMKRIDSAVDSVCVELKDRACQHDARPIYRHHSDLMQIVGFHGRLNDISVVDRCPDLLAPLRSAIEELLFHSGRPVIIVPPEAKSFSSRKVIIAWDGTAQAARAVGDALPFLINAQEVEIVCIVDDKDVSRLVAGTELAPYLSKHGIAARIVDLKRLGDEAAEVLEGHARSTGADLIVMGAFAHSRWRQLVLGGVTQSMLASTPVPTLMSH